MTHPASAAPISPADQTTDDLGTRIAELETLVRRRFDEISAEINATSQQVGMVEDGLAERFGGILEVIEAITHEGDGTTPANAGVELDAVVDMTEQAAARILDAAGRISTRLGGSVDWANDSTRQRLLDQVQMDVEEIFLACSFQDITGQRIRNTLENLKEIEERLTLAIEKLGITVESKPNSFLTKDYATSQGEIDALFDS